MEKPRHPLRDWRREHGITLDALARRVDVTQSHLSEIENWNNDPSLDLTHRLSVETGLDMAAFVRPQAEAAQ